MISDFTAFYNESVTQWGLDALTDKLLLKKWPFGMDLESLYISILALKAHRYAQLMSLL